MFPAIFTADYAHMWWRLPDLRSINVVAQLCIDAAWEGGRVGGGPVRGQLI